MYGSAIKLALAVTTPGVDVAAVVFRAGAETRRAAHGEASPIPYSPAPVAVPRLVPQEQESTR